MQREPVAKYGRFRVYFDPPTTQRSYARYSIYEGDKYIGATYSPPTASDCAFEKRRANGATYAQSSVQLPSHKYQIQPKTHGGMGGKYAISPHMHRTAVQNLAVKRAARKAPMPTVRKQAAEVDS